ncbi:MAG: hypothetical protein GF379_02515 [Candidatus Omnitrophica bacterium]|nr:hypothetical protein [Candidatus Omnitrophota bacterium]
MTEVRRQTREDDSSLLLAHSFQKVKDRGKLIAETTETSKDRHKTVDLIRET